MHAKYRDCKVCGIFYLKMTKTAEITIFTIENSLQGIFHVFQISNIWDFIFSELLGNLGCKFCT